MTKEIKPMSPLSRDNKSFANYGKEESGKNYDSFDFNQMNHKEINEALYIDPSYRQEKNIYNADNLSIEELELLINQHAGHLNDKIFNKFKPQWKLSKNDALAIQLDESETNILSATGQAYKVSTINNDNIIDPSITLEHHIKLLCFYSYSDYFLKKDYLKIIHGLEEDLSQEKINLEPKMKEALKKFIKEGKVISILKDAEDIYADVAKINDKYSIRLGDGKYFVASDDVQISFRDPSDNPAWAIWFMNAVPLSKVPDRGKLALLPSKEREKYMPEHISDRPIVCHASLWQLGEVSGVLLHTSWNHISVSYRWKIDKPIEIASILFKAVSLPSHIARNFGYAPQMRVPGEDWF